MSERSKDLKYGSLKLLPPICLVSIITLAYPTALLGLFKLRVLVAGEVQSSKV